MGFWFFGRHELLLVGTKGKFSPPNEKDRLPSLFAEQKTIHSKKPESFYEMIEKFFPNNRSKDRYCELFSRTKRNGWYCHGYEST